ncbi:HAD-IA family hydrolase [Latilactobacillus graminis]|nr:HAD-IA family hydrolase [Latilactobacillus graminis]
MPQATVLLQKLKAEHVKLYVTTNGVASTQYRRLEDADLMRYFDAIFISEELGWQKPDRHYFETVFQQLGNVPYTKALIIGDSLTSDVQGGQNIGVATAWYNPLHQKNEHKNLRPTYEIDELIKLLTI